MEKPLTRYSGGAATARLDIGALKADVAAVLDRLGEPTQIERDGQAIAVIVPVEAGADATKEDADRRAKVDAAFKALDEWRATLTPDQLEALDFDWTDAEERARRRQHPAAAE
jgi:antitoxin (DNA-binding transcriptional repressor) of toxin-antitoxin stability system